MADTATEQPTTSEQEYVLAGGKNGATDSPTDYDGLALPAKKQGHKCKTVWSMMTLPRGLIKIKNGIQFSWNPLLLPFYSSLGCGGCCDMRRATMIVDFVNMGKLEIDGRGTQNKH